MIVEWRLWWFGRQSSVPLPPDLSAGTLPVDLDLENELINKGRAGASKFHRIMGLLGISVRMVAHATMAPSCLQG